MVAYASNSSLKQENPEFEASLGYVSDVGGGGRVGNSAQLVERFSKCKALCLIPDTTVNRHGGTHT